MSDTPGTELVPATNQNGNGFLAQSLEDLRPWIADLVERSDVEQLGEVAQEADMLAALYAKQRGYEETVKHYARLRLEVLAAIGAIDIERNPFMRRLRGRLTVAGDCVSGYDRWVLRAVAMAQERGCLDEAASATNEISPGKVARAARALGATKASRAELRAMVEAAGWPVRKLAEPTGMTERQLRDYLTERIAPNRTRVEYAVARRVVRAIGRDPADLELAPDRSKRRRRIVPPRKRRQGRYDRLDNILREALQELNQLDGTHGRKDNEEVYSLLYKASDIVRRRA